MVVGKGRALFVLSVDIKDEADTQTQRAFTQLLNSLHQHHVPATWGLPSPGSSQIADRLAGDASHEMALLGDASWVGEQAGRTRFARELTSRIATAAARGICIRTLAVLDAKLEANLDLLVKHRISLIRSTATQRFRPQSLRFGVWQAPISFSLPGSSRWTIGGYEWSIARALTKAARAQDIVHVVVDLKRLAQQPDLASVNRILSVVRRRQNRNLVTAVTLGQIAEQLAPPRREPVSRSVLRAA